MLTPTIVSTHHSPKALTSTTIPKKYCAKSSSRRQQHYILKTYYQLLLPCPNYKLNSKKILYIGSQEFITGLQNFAKAMDG